MSKRGAIDEIDEDDNVVLDRHEQGNGHDQKRSKIENNSQLTTFKDNIQSLTTTVNLRNASLVLSEKASRLSSLAAPELHLTGHEGAIYSIDFDASGQHLASASMDQKICKLS